MTSIKIDCDKCGKKKRRRGLVIIKGFLVCSDCKPNRIWPFKKNNSSLEKSTPSSS